MEIVDDDYENLLIFEVSHHCQNVQKSSSSKTPIEIRSIKGNELSNRHHQNTPRVNARFLAWDEELLLL